MTRLVPSLGVRGARSSFALRTVVGGVVLVVALVLLASVAVVGIHRQQQIGQVTDSAHSRATLVGQLIERVSLPEAEASARDLAARPQLAALLGAHAAPTQVGALLAETRAPAGLDLYVVDATDAVTPVPGSTPWAGSAATLAAIANRNPLQTTSMAGQLAIVVAVPVRSAGATVGAVAAVVPLVTQAQRFAPAVGYPVVLLAPGTGARPVTVPASGGDVADASALVGGVVASLSPSTGEARMTRSTADGDVVLDLVRLPSGGFTGVAVPLPGFLAGEGGTLLSVALVALLAATLTSVAVLLGVDRWVRRPVAELERGVARIAEGDYTTDIPVSSHDELGRLAAGVNSMSGQIAAAMQANRAALSHLRWVSEALTAVDVGAAELSAAVARAAAAIAEGDRGSLPLTDIASCLIRRSGEAFAHGEPGDLAPEWAAAGRGDAAVSTRDAGGGAWVTSFPLAIDEGVVTGRLAVRSVGMLDGNEMAALTTLANYAGLALDHARLLEQEHETVRRLRAADAARAEFLSTTHHELRTPLSIVLGMAELAESSWDTVSDAARRRYLSGIVAGARRLARTIENVLTLTLLASEEVPLTRRPVALRPLLETVADQAVERWRSDGVRNLHVDVAADLSVAADRDFLERVVDAVVDNAVKFTQAGGNVELSAAADADAAVIRVRDDGVGITAQALPHVFERFYQAEKGHARQFGGLGLGLTIAARICALHGATIAIAAREGRGTEVTVRWPVAAAVAPRPQVPALPVA